MDDLPEAEDAPYLIVHSDRCGDREIKVLTFQNAGSARAFSAGWRRALGKTTIGGPANIAPLA